MKTAASARSAIPRRRLIERRRGGEADFVTTAGSNRRRGRAVAPDWSGSRAMDRFDRLTSRRRFGSVRPSRGFRRGVRRHAEPELRYHPGPADSISDSGTVVFQYAAGAGAVSLPRSSRAQPASHRCDRARIRRQRRAVGTAPIRPVPTACRLRRLLRHLRARPAHASIDPDNPAQIICRPAGCPIQTWPLVDVVGSPLEEIGLFSGISDFSDAPSQVFASGTQSQVFQDGDAILLNGTELDLGPATAVPRLAICSIADIVLCARRSC